MAIIKCARTAAAVGRLHPQDRKAMERLWAREYVAAVAAGGGTLHGNLSAEKQANRAVHQAMIALAQHRKIVARLQKEAMDRIDADAAQFRNRKGTVDIGEFGLQLINRVHFRAQALFKLDLAEISSMMHEFRKRPFTGARHNRARMDLVVRELFGENTGDATAKAFARAWIALAARKIDQFKEAGGNVVCLRADWHLPQVHDALAVARAGLDEWKNYIRPRLDMSKMTNPRTGTAFTTAEFEDMLDEAFVSITYQANMEEPTMEGGYGTATWRRHADPRFFVFKDAASWMEYSKRFGAGSNPFEVMIGYLRSINHDLAAMQTLGPHANGTVRYLAGSGENLGGRILHEAQLAEKGEPSLFPPANDMGKPFTADGRVQYAKNKAVGMQRAWSYFTGEARRPFNKGWALAEGTISNLLYAKMLAFTPFLVGGDIVNQAATRAFRSLSVSGMMRDLVDAVRLSTDRKTLAELGVEIDTGLSVMMSEARDHATVLGHPISQYVVDRSLTFTGLKPMTMGLRAMWTMGVLHDMTRHANTAFNKLPAPFREMLERYDIDEHAWSLIQNAPRQTRRGVDVIAPSDIAGMSMINQNVRARPGLSAGEEVATRLLTLIQEEGEAATISGTPRSARIMPYKPGSISGTFTGSLAKLKTYSISHFQHHGFRAAEIFWRNGGGLRGLPPAAGYYMAGLILPSMALVALGTVIQQVLQGRDPPDVSDPEFVKTVFWKTVSLGFYQDFIRGMTDADTPVQAGAQLGGPTVSALTDTATLGAYALSDLNAAVTGGEDETQTGRQALRTVRNFVPRHWAVDTAVERLIWDNMQRAVDPEAEADFARRARRVEQGYWWEPGSDNPGAIDWSTLDLQDQDRDYAGP